VRRFAPQLFAQLFCIALAVFTISNSHAQIPNRRGAPLQERDREWALENLRQRARHQPKARETRLIEVSVRNDFRQLQIVNNSLMKRVFERAPTKKISNKEIRSSLNEIKKLAQRLSDSFGIPTTKDKPKSEVALTAGLLQLDKAIMSFVDNPMFQQLRVYDAELVSQAGKDLSDVLRLADLLKSLTKDD
jgi:hypothetical protein